MVIDQHCFTFGHPDEAAGRKVLV